MHTLMTYSEAGGVTKTTAAVSVAMCAARQGTRTVLIDFDPRAAATAWLDIEPTDPGHTSHVLLAADGGADWIDQLVVESPWEQMLGIIPSTRVLSTREETSADPSDDLRLVRALRGLTAAGVELVVLDLPNRQGGPITRAALAAAQGVIYAANPSPDGVAGVEGARVSVDRFRATRREIGAVDPIAHEWIVCGAWLHPAVPSAIDKAGIGRLRDTGLLVEPIVPHRAIVQECRATGSWYGDYDRGQAVLDAYETITTTIMDQLRRAAA